MTDTVTELHRPLALSRVALYGLIAIIASTVANLIVRTVGMAIIPVSPDFNPLSEPTATILFTTGLVFIASIVFAVVDRVPANPARLFNIIALIALLLSMVSEFGMLIDPSKVPIGGITVGAVSILLVQHMVAYAVTVYTLTVLAYRQ